MCAGELCSALIIIVLGLDQRSLCFSKFTLQVNALVNFLGQNLIDLRQILRGIVDFYFQLVGSLQRMGDIAGLHMAWQLLLEHGIDHDQFGRRLLYRFLYGFIPVKCLGQRAEAVGRLQIDGRGC